jgi:hypothetical protein
LIFAAIPRLRFSAQSAKRRLPKKGQRAGYLLLMTAEMFLHRDNESIHVPNEGGCGLHPIGSDCVKMLGVQWTTRQ